MPSEEKRIMAVHQSYEGPLPPASEMAKYNDTCPGAADRIIKMAEEAQKAFLEIEKKNAKARARMTILSVVFAFLCIVLLCVVIVIAMYLSAPLVSIATAISAIAAVAGIFIYNKKQNNK